MSGATNEPRSTTVGGFWCSCGFSTADSRVLFLLYLLEHQWKHFGKNIIDEVSNRMTSEPIGKVRISTSSGPVLFLTTQKG